MRVHVFFLNVQSDCVTILNVQCVPIERFEVYESVIKVYEMSSKMMTPMKGKPANVSCPESDDDGLLSKPII